MQDSKDRNEPLSTERVSEAQAFMARVRENSGTRGGR